MQKKTKKAYFDTFTLLNAQRLGLKPSKLLLRYCLSPSSIPPRPPPFSHSYVCHTRKFYQANLLFETQPHPFLAFFKPNLTL